MKHWQIVNIMLVLYDSFTIVASYILALLLRFDFSYSKIDKPYIPSVRKFLPIFVVLCLVIYYFFGLYSSIWQFASINELERCIGAIIVALLTNIALTLIFFMRMPISYYVFGICFQFIFTISIRFIYRFVLLLRSKNTKKKNNVLVIGAGEAGTMILRDLNRSVDGEDRVVCIIDDNNNKWNRRIDGVKVIGGRALIQSAVKEFNIKKIVYAIPSSTIEERTEILNICKDTDCEIKIIPAMYKFVKNNLSVDSLKDIQIEDLLGREPVKVDLEKVFKEIKNKTILVTGGGGSIGSELCRQIASHNPKQLIIFDIYENSTYEIELELRDKYPDLNLKVLIGSVRDKKKVLDLFKTYKPDIVYHAAAHKHVPLMETSPNEAIKNNVLGTYNVAYGAMLNNAKRFVLISTDKAVNPTNIMGASKRMCEMIIQSFARGDIKDLVKFYPKEYQFDIKKNNTTYSAVRFGNVLGSNGSVIPIFKKQIAQGGPVKVTDKNIVRYFMTIPEAVSLVLESSVYSKGGEIFVLDMGEQVKIDDLARNLIKLAGLKPDRDIKIVYTGLRPGEKMYEERLMDEEGLTKTANKKISIGKPLDFNTKEFLSNLRKLIDKTSDNDTSIKKDVSKIVTTYKPKGL